MPPADIRVVHYVDDRIADPGGRATQLSWQNYHRARNRILRVCRRHGTVGPMAECPITRAATPYGNPRWRLGSFDPDYFILDDQLNDERYVYVEVQKKRAMTARWIADVEAALRQMPGWGVCLTGMPNAYAIVFPRLLLVTGAQLKSTRDLNSTVARMADVIGRRNRRRRKHQRERRSPEPRQRQ